MCSAEVGGNKRRRGCGGVCLKILESSFLPFCVKISVNIITLCVLPWHCCVGNREHVCG